MVISKADLERIFRTDLSGHDFATREGVKVNEKRRSPSKRKSPRTIPLSTRRPPNRRLRLENDFGRSQIRYLVVVGSSDSL